MSVDPSRVAILDTDLRAAGIPIIGVALLDGSTIPPTVRVDFSENVTSEQMLLAQQIVDNFDWRRRVALTGPEIYAGFSALLPSQKTSLIENGFCDSLSINQAFARHLTQRLGIPLPIDQIAAS